MDVFSVFVIAVDTALHSPTGGPYSSALPAGQGARVEGLRRCSHAVRKVFLQGLQTRASHSSQKNLYVVQRVLEEETERLRGGSS